jgi:hypothetical protein
MRVPTAISLRRHHLFTSRELSDQERLLTRDSQNQLAQTRREILQKRDRRVRTSDNMESIFKVYSLMMGEFETFNYNLLKYLT